MSTVSLEDTTQPHPANYMRSYMSKGGAFVKAHASVNKLIGVIGIIACTSIFSSSHRTKPSPIKIQKFMKIASLLSLQKKIAHLCNGISGKKPISVGDWVVQHLLPSNPTRRSNLLAVSACAKAILAAYTLKRVHESCRTKLPAIFRIALYALTTYTLVSFSYNNHKAEQSMIRRTPTLEEQEAKANIQILKGQISSALRRRIPYDTNIDKQLEHYITSSLQPTQLVFRGFGQSWTLTPDADLSNFEASFNSINFDRLLTLDSVWVRTDDANLYNRRQRHFNSFCLKYTNCRNSRNQEILRTFAQIYPFDVEVNNIKTMQTFILNHKKRTLIGAIPALKTKISTLYATSYQNQEQTILRSAYMIKWLCDDTILSLTKSKQIGDLTADCEHKLSLLKNLTTNVGDLHDALVNINTDTITTLDIDTLQNLIEQHVKNKYLEYNLPTPELRDLHSHHLFDTNLSKDSKYTEAIEKISEYLDTANSIKDLQLSSHNNYLEQLQENAEEQTVKCGKCKRITKETGRYTAITASATGALYLGLNPYLVVPMALYGIPPVKRRIDRAIKAQICYFKDTGESSFKSIIQHAKNDAKARFNSIIQKVSPQILFSRFIRKLKQNCHTARTDFGNHFSTTPEPN